MRRTLNTLLRWAAWLFLASASSQFGGDLFSGNGWVRGAVIPIFLRPGEPPALVVRADNIYRDYQRKGFFRIGLLPLGVMEGVTFEVRNIEGLSNSLVRLDRWLGPRAASRFEFRQATIQLPGIMTHRLQAGRIHFLPGGTCELLDEVRAEIGTNQVQATHATLRLTGDRTGLLVMATTPPWTTNFFTSFPSEPSTNIDSDEN